PAFPAAQGGWPWHVPIGGGALGCPFGRQTLDEKSFPMPLRDRGGLDLAQSFQRRDCLGPPFRIFQRRRRRKAVGGRRLGSPPTFRWHAQTESRWAQPAQQVRQCPRICRVVESHLSAKWATAFSQNGSLTTGLSGCARRPAPRRVSISMSPPCCLDW